MSQPTAPPEDVRDRVRFADTVADAILSTFDKRDGDTIRTKGRITSGVGGGDYTYHLTGRPSVTTDLGFYIAGSGADDYLELQDKTVVRMEQFGLVDDPSYATDQSTLMQNAWDTAAAYGGLQITIPVGKFMGTVLANYPAATFPSVRGFAAHTHLRAANDNEFALTCLREASGLSHYKIPSVEDITFYGSPAPAPDYHRARHGLQVNFGEVFHVRRCYFFNCNIALANNATWGLYCDGNSYRENNVGELLTGRNDTNGFVSSTSILDQTGASDQTVLLTQPYALWTDNDPAGRTQNPTVSTHIGCDYTNNALAIVYEVPDAQYSVNYESNWFGGTIQGLTGVWVRDAPAHSFWARTNPPLAFYNVHWEHQTDATYTYDGIVIPTHDIVQEAGTIKLGGGPSPIKRLTQSGGVIYANDFSYPTEAFEQSGGAFVSCDRLLGHNINATKNVVAKVLAPLVKPGGTGNSGIAARIPDRHPVYSDTTSELGTLVAGADGFNANLGSYGGRTASTYNGSTREYIAGESPFGYFARYSTTGSGNQGTVLTADPVLTVGTQDKPYFMSVRLRASKAITLTCLISGWNRSFNVTTDWQTFGIIGRPDADFTFIYIYTVNDTVDIDVSMWQMMSFDADYDVERYQRAGYYTMSSIQPLVGREGAHLLDPPTSQYAISQVPDGDVHVRVTDSTGYTKQGSLLAGCTWGLQDNDLITRLNGDGDEDGVDDAADWSYANLDAMWTGTPAYASGPTGATTSAFSFDGTTYLTLDRILSVSDDFTVSLWINPTSVPSTQVLLDCLGGGGGFQIVIQTDTGVRFYDSAAASNLCGAAATGAWVHIAVSNIGGTLQGYLNGEPYGPEWSPTMVTDSVVAKVATNATATQKYIGDLYDLRIYSRGFTAREINSELSCVAPSHAKRATPTLITSSGTLTESRTLSLNGNNLLISDDEASISLRPADQTLGIGCTNGNIQLEAGGDISLSSTGNVKFGNYSAIGAETVQGYIEIKDAGGTVRKIAVVS